MYNITMNMTIISVPDTSQDRSFCHCFSYFHSNVVRYPPN